MASTHAYELAMECVGELQEWLNKIYDEDAYAELSATPYSLSIILHVLGAEFRLWNDQEDPHTKLDFRSLKEKFREMVTKIETPLLIDPR